MKKRMILFLGLMCGLKVLTVAQTLGLDALRIDYPMLMKKFEDEVQQQRADYFFVIDVSGSMNKYQDIVIPSLNEFFSSLQDGDYVNVIHFGAEAEVVNGCYGTIDKKKIQSLCSNTNHIYFDGKPGDPVLKEKYWNHTDLDNAMHTLANEMHQLGLNSLKFVFIITDFEHDPPATRQGKEDWESIRQQFEREQTKNNVNVITLQLPGNPTHLKHVQDCFPMSFAYQSKSIADGSDLASWFTRLKNFIMHDRFKAIVSKKLQDANLRVSPEVDINGNMELKVSWQTNNLFDSIRVNSVEMSDTRFSVKNFSTVSIGEEKGPVSGLNIMYNKCSWIPTFHRLNGEVVVEAAYDAPYIKELENLLGKEMPLFTSSSDVSRVLFCHPWSLERCIVLLALLLFYLLMVFVSLYRARAYRIQGSFYVTDNGLAVTNRQAVANRSAIGIGQHGYTIQVANCNWDVEIFEHTYPAIIPILHLMRPKYKIRLKRGGTMAVANRVFRTGVSVSLARRSNVIVDKTFTIHWL